MPEDDFASAVAGYDFKLGNGYLEVNTFAGMIRACMSRDGITEQPSLDDIVSLLLSMVRDKDPDHAARIFEIEMHPKLRDEQIYPGGICICLHVAALVHVRELWVWNIGQETPGHATDQGMGYMAWLRPEWVHTRAFVQRFHRQCVELEIGADRSRARTEGYSLFECLHHCRREGLDMEAGAERLRMRNAGLQSALARMELSIHAGFPLEAIVIGESLMSSCMHSFLLEAKTPNPPSGFSQLLAGFRNAGRRSKAYPSDLVDEIDEWRRSRNDATHRFVARDPCELERGQAVFLMEALQTASVGLDLARRMAGWFHEESFYFLNTDFDLPGPTLN